MNMLVSTAAIAAASNAAVSQPQDDRVLLELEDKIFEQYEAATAYDDEIIRLSEIWTDECKRLYREALAAEAESGVYLSSRERWKLVTDIPECREHNRLCKLQEPHYLEMDRLVRQMFATPAHTAEGRRAKVMVLLGCILDDDWRRADDETDYPEQMARNLLIEFVGGEAAEQLRDQFKAEPDSLVA